MILIISHCTAFETDFVIDILRKRQVSFVRLNLDLFPTFTSSSLSINQNGLTSGNIQRQQNLVDLSEVKVAWLHNHLQVGINPELDDLNKLVAQKESFAFLEGLFDIHNWKWVNEPRAGLKASNKIYQMYMAGKVGFSQPDTIISNNPTDVISFFDKHNGNVIIKDLNTHAIENGQEILASFTQQIQRSDLDADSIRIAPVFMQEKIPKKYELRITIVNNQVFTARIIDEDNEHGLDYRSAFDSVRIEPHTLDLTLEKQCLDLTRSLNIKYGCVDMIIKPNGEPIFLEINTNGAWVWVEDATNYKISDCIANMLVELLSN